MIVIPARAGLIALSIASASAQQVAKDWLVEPAGFKARIERNAAAREVTLTNGLVSRTFFAGPNLATIGYTNHSSGQSMLRAVRPEGSVTINGVKVDIGGLTGQANQAFFSRAEVETLTADPAALRFSGMTEETPVAPFEWKRVRHHVEAPWPPKGVAVRFDFTAPAAAKVTTGGEGGLFRDDFAALDPGWKIHKSSAHPRVSFSNEGKAGEIYGPFGMHCYAERVVPEGAGVFEVALDPGTDKATSWGLGMALVFGQDVIKANLRPGDRGEHGHFGLRVNGAETLATLREFSDKDGGLDLSTPYRLRATLTAKDLVWEVARESRPLAWKPLFSTPRPSAAPTALRVGKMDTRGGATDHDYGLKEEDIGRGKIQEVVIGRAPAAGAAAALPDGVRVSVTYELYDGLPCLMKRIVVHNEGKAPFTVDKITTELLAMPEYDNRSSTRRPIPPPDALIVTTDFAFGGDFEFETTNDHVVRYLPDPTFKTQSDYTLKNPCLLEVSPDRGPAQDVAPGADFESFRTFELAVEGDRERRMLAYRKMMRTVAPWVTENPLMMHVRSSDPKVVRTAIDQCAEVGFEMVILSFGSGFNAENDDPAYLARWKEMADYAKSKGIEIGTYSLYASRSVGGGNDIVPPKDQPLRFGNCPAITSPWGRAYLEKLRNLYATTGFSVFENDGPYPGDVDTTARPPFQKGADDSQWQHWKIWTGFYRHLRATGVFLNQPDYYFLNGGNKTGMGYREVNWSLPRAQQLIHTRLNNYDGTWERTPSMGWMFVPLTQYHGGGAAATIEPLDEHIDHYRMMMLSNLAAGVQACYRGTRLYDTPRVREMVKANVDWFKKYRTILESDVIHVRRPDGRSLDGLLHVDPAGEIPAMLCVFNPGDTELTETWEVPLHYAGLNGRVRITDATGKARDAATDGRSKLRQTLTVPPNSMAWFTYGR